MIRVRARNVRAGVMAPVVAEDGSFLRAMVERVYTVPGDGFADPMRFLAAAGLE